MTTHRSPGLVQHRTFDESEEMAVYLEGWDIELMQLEAGRFSGEHVVAGDGPVLLQGGRTGRALIQRGACPPRPTFCIPARPDLGWVFRGRATSAAEVTIVRPGENFSVRSDTGFPIYSLSIDEGHFRDVARGIGLEGTAETLLRNRWIRPSDDSMTALRRAWQWISSGPGADATKFGARQWSRRLEFDLVRVLIRTLATANGPAEFDAVRSMDRIVQAVERALDKRPRHAFSVRELSDAVGVNERTLRRSVRAWYGAPLTRIVRTRRLHGARRDLRAAPPDRVRVTSVAMSWGFEHLGRFAGDYRALFGETPSQTLARAD